MRNSSSLLTRAIFVRLQEYLLKKKSR